MVLIHYSGTLNTVLNPRLIMAQRMALRTILFTKNLKVSVSHMCEEHLSFSILIDYISTHF